MGRAALRGEPAAAEGLRAALAVPPFPERLGAEERALVERSLSMHLFHSFAARTHPLTVRQLFSGVGPGQRVLDPFVGSGTVLVEAALAGAAGVGLDVGALQVRLSRFKATPMPAPMREALLARARAVAEASLERVRTRQRPGRRWDDPVHYEPHVYLELCGLREEIGAVLTADPPLGEALLLLLSSLIIKASRQEAETSARVVRRSLGKGQVSRWFLRRAEELARLLAAFSARVPPNTPRPDVRQGDAREGLDLPPGTVDVVVTSPPYLGVYDYAAHHARRSAWLGIDVGPQWEREIGARRGGGARERLRRHQADTEAWVGQVARLLRPGAPLHVLVGDSVLGGEVFPGDEPVLRAAAAAGLRFEAACSVERGGGRREHLLLLRRPAMT